MGKAIKTNKAAKFILYYGAPICLKFVSASMISTMRRQEKNCYSLHEANKAGPTTKHKTSLLNSASLTFTMRMNWQMTRHFMKISSWILQYISKISITNNQQFYNICSACFQHVPNIIFEVFITHSQLVCMDMLSMFIAYAWYVHSICSAYPEHMVSMFLLLL